MSFFETRLYPTDAPANDGIRSPKSDYYRALNRQDSFRDPLRILVEKALGRQELPTSSPEHPGLADLLTNVERDQSTIAGDDINATTASLDFALNQLGPPPQVADHDVDGTMPSLPTGSSK